MSTTTMSRDAQAYSPAKDSSIQTTLGQPCVIHEDYVEVSLPSGSTKIISLATFYDILSDSISAEKSSIQQEFLLPANCYLFGISNAGLEVSCYYPGKNREITFQIDTVLEKMEIVFPNIVINHRLCKVSEGWRLHDSHYFATEHTIKSLPLKHIRDVSSTEKIWVLPLPNMYGDGRMCYGRNSLVVNFTENLRGLDWYFQMLYQSPFNSDLSIRSLKSPKSPKEWLKHLSLLAADNKEFPYSELY